MKKTGILFIIYIIVSYIYALVIVYHPTFGMNIYNFIGDYSTRVKELMPMYMVMLISFFIGWKLVFKKVKKNIKINYKFINSKKTKSIGMLTSVTLLIVSIVLLYLVYREGILYRDTYHPKNLHYGFLVVYKILTLFLIILIYLSKKIKNINKILLLTTIIIISLSIGSRISVIYLILLFLMYLFTNKNIRFFKTLLYMVSIMFLLVFIQYSRGLEENGLFGIIKYTNFSDMFNYFYFVLYYSFPYSVFVTAGTYDNYIELSKIKDFMIMLNPLPGYLAGWYNINLNMAIIPVVPYSSIGTIFTLGYTGIIIFYFLLGIIVGYIDSFIQKMNCSRNYFLAIIVWSLMLLFIVFHNQYTLRTSTRYIYYNLFIIIIFKLYKFLKKQYPKKK